MTEVPLGIVIDTQEDQADPLTIAGIQSMVLQNRIVAIASGVNTLGSSIMMLQFMQMRKMIAEQIMQVSQERVWMAYSKYEYDMHKLGSQSAETIKAHRELIIAQNNMERSTMRANRLMELSYLEIIPITLTIIGSLIAVTSALLAVSGGKGMHSGGVVSESGMYTLEAGESIRGAKGETPGEYNEHNLGGDSSGFDHNLIYEAVEYEKRRKFSVSSRAQ